MMASPKYSYPTGLVAALARDILLLRRRDFRKDARACIQHLIPPLQVGACELIPQHGPCVITVNHYHRKGFNAQWLALAIASQVPAPMHWIMTSEFTYPDKWYERLGSMGSRVLLQRIARVYGFTNMPPMPPREKDVDARAASVRAVLDYVKRTNDPIIGLAPEGHDPPEGTLTRPAPGVGRFGLLFARAGLSFVPVGAYEADGIFHLQFGPPYTLTVPHDLAADEKDGQASQIIMKSLARLLPHALRGEFS